MKPIQTKYFNSGCISIILALTLLITACSGDKEINIPVEEVKFTVSGMYCDGCVKAVEVELKRIDGLTDIVVSLDDSTVTFKAKQNKIPTNRELSDIVEELGYTAIFD